MVLGVSLIAELLVHGKPAQVCATAFDVLLRIELEAVAIEESSGGKTHMGGNYRGSGDTQRGLDALVGRVSDGSELEIVIFGQELGEMRTRLR
jgi:hypothetical protein